MVKYFNILDKTTYVWFIMHQEPLQPDQKLFIPKAMIIASSGQFSQRKICQNTLYIRQGEAILKPPNSLKRII